MIKHAESHLDHQLTPQAMAFIFERFADKREFFIETVELPRELASVPCGLWGPAMGDAPIVDGMRGFMLPPGEYIVPTGTLGSIEDDLWTLPIYDGKITYAKRGARGWDSRLINAPMRPSRLITVIAGPHENHACILYTAYAGPAAPQEPTDPKLTPQHPRYAEAVAFWADHALSRYA